MTLHVTSNFDVDARVRVSKNTGKKPLTNPCLARSSYNGNWTFSVLLARNSLPPAGIPCRSSYGGCVRLGRVRRCPVEYDMWQQCKYASHGLVFGNYALRRG